MAGAVGGSGGAAGWGQLLGQRGFPRPQGAGLVVCRAEVWELRADPALGWPRSTCHCPETPEMSRGLAEEGLGDRPGRAAVLSQDPREPWAAPSGHLTFPGGARGRPPGLSLPGLAVSSEPASLGVSACQNPLGLVPPSVVLVPKRRCPTQGKQEWVPSHQRGNTSQSPQLLGSGTLPPPEAGGGRGQTSPGGQLTWSGLTCPGASPRTGPCDFVTSFAF